MTRHRRGCPAYYRDSGAGGSGESPEKQSRFGIPERSQIVGDMSMTHVGVRFACPAAMPGPAIIGRTSTSRIITE